MTTVLAVDLGSASGRVLAGTLTDGRLDVTDIHRFKHEARRRQDGTLTWDVATMEAETIIGLKKALEQFPDARSVSIDTWGVDWAPLDENGDLVGDVIAYRDERTSRTLDSFRERIGDREFFDLTGNQPATSTRRTSCSPTCRKIPPTLSASRGYSSCPTTSCTD